MTVEPVVLRHIGGPTAVIDIGGRRLIVDPTFDPPGSYPTPNYTLTKTAGPALSASEVGPIDVVLLSHHQHEDNLDNAGRALLATVPLVLSTPGAAAALGAPVTPLATWDQFRVTRPGGGHLEITAVPGRHGPAGTEALTGPVTGFLLAGEHLPTVYVSGDNASLDAVQDVSDRFPVVDVAVLFGGAARSARLGDAKLTLDAEDMVEAARILDARHVFPVHADSWAHFREGLDDITAAFHRAGLADRLVVPPQHGKPETLR